MKTICVDLDGVLATYDGWRGDDHIGEPILGAREFMELLKERFNIVVFTTRCSMHERSIEQRDENIHRVKHWLKEHLIPYDSVYAGSGKPIAVAYVDDRAVSCRPQENGISEFAGALSSIEKLLK